jgi:hypothetical protein
MSHFNGAMRKWGMPPRCRTGACASIGGSPEVFTANGDDDRFTSRRCGGRNCSQTCSPGHPLWRTSTDGPTQRTTTEQEQRTSVNRYMSESPDPKVPGSRPGRPTANHRHNPNLAPPNARWKSPMRGKGMGWDQFTATISCPPAFRLPSLERLGRGSHTGPNA